MKNKMQSTVYTLALCLVFAAATRAQTTEFTFQGRFSDSTVSQPTNGTYQMQFALFGAADGSNQIGATITRPTVQVVNGIFTVNLDFGANSFSGASRFLQVSVFSPAANAFVTMNPRQAVTSAPYSIKSLNADVADVADNSNNLGNVPANQYVQTNDSRLSDDRNPIPGSTNYVQNRATEQANANFNISGNGTAGGTLTGSVVSATTQFNIGLSRVLSVAGTNNTFTGFGAGTSNTGINNSFFGRSAGFDNTTGNQNSFFGSAAGANNTSGSENSFVGGNAGGANTTGSYNSFFGANAGSAVTFGSNNVAVGYNAGKADGVCVENNNIFIGYNAGADCYYGAISNSVAIGANAKVYESNTIVLGTGSTKVQIPGVMDDLTVSGFLETDFLEINTLSNGGNNSLCYNGTTRLVSACSSSRRYKTNIQPFVSNVSLITRLSPVTFNWKSDGSLDLGLVAEEVAAIEPLLATYKDGRVEGVKYDRIGVVLVNAVKEQQKEIESLRQQIELLKKLVCAANGQAEVCK